MCNGIITEYITGIEYLQWEYCTTHDGNRIVNNGNITEHTMGIEYLQWECNP